MMDDFLNKMHSWFRNAGRQSSILMFKGATMSVSHLFTTSNLCNWSGDLRMESNHRATFGSTD